MRNVVPLDNDWVSLFKPSIFCWLAFNWWTWIDVLKQINWFNCPSFCLRYRVDSAEWKFGTVIRQFSGLIRQTYLVNSAELFGQFGRLIGHCRFEAMFVWEWLTILEWLRAIDYQIDWDATNEDMVMLITSKGRTCLE